MNLTFNLYEWPWPDGDLNFAKINLNMISFKIGNISARIWWSNQLVPLFYTGEGRGEGLEVAQWTADSVVPGLNTYGLICR